jgi:hypothetical protein
MNAEGFGINLQELETYVGGGNGQFGRYSYNPIYNKREFHSVMDLNSPAKTHFYKENSCKEIVESKNLQRRSLKNEGKTRLERELIDLVDNDESNNYSPRNSSSQLGKKKCVNSDIKTDYKSKVSKSFQENPRKPSQNLEEERADIVPEMFNTDQPDLTDDATLEEIFMSDLSLYRTSDRKSKGNSFRESIDGRSNKDRISLRPERKNNDRYSMGQAIAEKRQNEEIEGNRHSMGVQPQRCSLGRDEANRGSFGLNNVNRFSAGRMDGRFSGGGNLNRDSMGMHGRMRELEEVVFEE